MKKYLKVIIFIIGLVAFESLTYLLAKLSPIEPHLLASNIDNKIPVIKFFVLFYYLWYVFLFVLPFIFYKKNKDYFFDYAGVNATSIILAFPIFIFYPTTIVRNVALGNSLFDFLLKVVYFIDTPILNCLPSMHCALCFIFIYETLKVKDLKWYYKLIIIISSFGIIASTLFIKQHVIVDVIGGFILVIIAILINKYFKINEKIEKLFNKVKSI